MSRYLEGRRSDLVQWLEKWARSSLLASVSQATHSPSNKHWLSLYCMQSPAPGSGHGEQSRVPVEWRLWEEIYTANKRGWRSSWSLTRPNQSAVAESYTRATGERAKEGSDRRRHLRRDLQWEVGLGEKPAEGVQGQEGGVLGGPYVDTSASVGGEWKGNQREARRRRRTGMRRMRRAGVRPWGRPARWASL